MSNLFANRFFEEKNNSLAQSHQFYPKEILYFSNKTGLCLTSFISQEFFPSQSELSNIEGVKQVAASLKKLHQSNFLFPLNFDHWKRWQITKRILNEQEETFPPEVMDLVTDLKKKECLIHKSLFLKKPSHIDPNPQNLVWDSKRSIRFIDWELAANADPAWDLAFFSEIANIGPHFEAQLVKFYDSSDSLLIHKMNFYRPFVWLGSTIWAWESSLACKDEHQKNLSSILYQCFLNRLKNIVKINTYENSLNILQQRSRSMTSISYLALRQDHFENFQLKTEVSSCFIEWNGKLLVLKRAHKEDQSATWGIPGGKLEKGEEAIQALVREIFEETQLPLKENDFIFKAKRFVRIPGWDYILYIFHTNLDQEIEPKVTLDPAEHDEYLWVTKEEFKSLNLLKGQDEAFDIVYTEVKN